MGSSLCKCAYANSEPELRDKNTENDYQENINSLPSHTAPPIFTTPLRNHIDFGPQQDVSSIHLNNDAIGRSLCFPHAISAQPARAYVDSEPELLDTNSENDYQENINRLPSQTAPPVFATPLRNHRKFVPQQDVSSIHLNNDAIGRGLCFPHAISAQPARAYVDSEPELLDTNSENDYQENINRLPSQTAPPVFATPLRNHRKFVPQQDVSSIHLNNDAIGRGLCFPHAISAQPARAYVDSEPELLDTNSENDYQENINRLPSQTAPPVFATPLRNHRKFVPQQDVSSIHLNNDAIGRGSNFPHAISTQPARSIPLHSEEYSNAQRKRRRRRRRRYLQPIDNLPETSISNTQRKCEHNVAREIAKLKIYSNQRTENIKLVESWFKKNISLKNITTNISKDSRVFYNINKIFMKSTQSHYRILRIEEILNPYLKLSYLLRRKEYCLLYGEKNVKEIHQFHGTKKSNIENIVNNNFDWRLHGKAKGNIFGKGVSFSPISNYACNYCDKTEEKCMLAVNVLKSFSCEGNKSTIIPPILNAAINLHYDTTEKPNGNVCVKFRDDEFYPQYLIYFVGSPIKKKNHN